MTVNMSLFFFHCSLQKASQRLRFHLGKVISGSRLSPTSSWLDSVANFCPQGHQEVQQEISYYFRLFVFHFEVKHLFLLQMIASTHRESRQLCLSSNSNMGLKFMQVNKKSAVTLLKPFCKQMEGNESTPVGVLKVVFICMWMFWFSLQEFIVLFGLLEGGTVDLWFCKHLPGTRRLTIWMACCRLWSKLFAAFFKFFFLAEFQGLFGDNWNLTT